MKRILASLGLCSVLSGCVAVGPSFKAPEEPSPDRCAFYCYRPMSTAIGESYQIYVDQKKVASMKVGGYCRYEVAPGLHQIGKKIALQSIKDMHVREVEMMGGRNYYYNAASGGVIAESRALQEISKTRRQSCAANPDI